MSGFLNNLVTKSLHPTASIRPRLPSRFEPEAGSVAHVPSEAVAQPARAPAPNDAGTANQSNATPHLVAHAAAPGSHAAPPSPVPSVSRILSPQSPAPPVATLVAVAAPAPPMSGFQTPQSPVPEPPTVPAPLLIERTIERLTVERLVAPDRTPAAPDGTLTPLQPRITPLDAHAATRLDSPSPRSTTVDDPTIIIMHEQRTDSMPSTLVPRPPERIVERTLVAERPGAVLAQPQVTRRSELARPFPASAAPPAAPTIHVTIGRIEVRATQHSGQAARPRQEPARLSLDDYLRQRSRGGDR